MHVLSKSSYIRGRQCPKALWLSKHRRDLKAPVDEAKQAIFNTGTEVGLLARGLFPGGVDCSPLSPNDFGPAILATKAAIQRGERVIYEAAFLHDEVLVALDILVRDGDEWTAYEVKSTTAAKDYHVQDAALQAHVIEGNGLRLAEVRIVHLDNNYVRQGPLDVKELFGITSVKAAVDSERRDVPERIAQLKATVQALEEPQVGIGPHCDDPFECDYKGYCWAHVPKERSVFDLVRGGKRVWELYGRGVLRLEDIPEAEKLSAAQRTQVDGWQRGRSVIDRARINEFVRSLQYPLHHLDFETLNPAIPLYDGTRPYQQVPFQYSLHTEAVTGAEPTHRAFLADGKSDPRHAFIRQLLDDLGSTGDVLTYNMSFERGRLIELAQDLPQYAQAIEAILPRLKDLMVPFQQGWYYLPTMNGSYSIKYVLPATVPDLSYAKLNIQEGGTASRRFEQLSKGLYEGDTHQLRSDLLEYCAMDTMAMVKILEVLRHVGP